MRWGNSVFFVDFNDQFFFFFVYTYFVDLLICSCSLSLDLKHAVHWFLSLSVNTFCACVFIHTFITTQMQNVRSFKRTNEHKIELMHLHSNCKYFVCICLIGARNIWFFSVYWKTKYMNTHGQQKQYHHHHRRHSHVHTISDDFWLFHSAFSFRWEYQTAEHWEK